MTQIIFSFTVNPDTQEAVFAGNISPQQALTILQQIVIIDAVKKSKEVKPDVLVAEKEE